MRSDKYRFNTLLREFIFTRTHHRGLKLISLISYIIIFYTFQYHFYFNLVIYTYLYLVENG